MNDQIMNGVVAVSGRCVGRVIGATPRQQHVNEWTRSSLQIGPTTAPKLASWTGVMLAPRVVLPEDRGSVESCSKSPNKASGYV